MAQNRDWQHLGQSGIGSLKRHGEGDMYKRNGVTQENVKLLPAIT